MKVANTDRNQATLCASAAARFPTGRTHGIRAHASAGVAANGIMDGHHPDDTLTRMEKTEEPDMEIRGCTFLVSGGGSGLGAATARMLVAHGANTLLADIDPQQGQLTADSLGAQAIFTRTDVTSEHDVQAALALGLQRFGALHGAINCAGIAFAERTIGKQGPHRLDTFRRAIEVNLIGAFNVLRLAAEVLVDNPPDANGERGVIVNTASIAAYEGQIGQVAYAAAKGGIAGLTLPAARDLASFGIRVMAIAPGTFDTPMLAGLPEQARLTLGAQTPFPPRLGQPDEFAALVVHILQNPMLNGTTIRLDGALRMPPR